MGDLVTRQQLAAMWGVSPSAIDNHVQEGRLRKAGRGLFDLDEANQARAAMKAHGLRTDTIVRMEREAQAPKAPPKAPRKAKAAQQAPSSQPPPQDSPSPEAAADGPAGPDLRVVDGGKVAQVTSVLAAARTQREVFSARTAEMNFQKARGALVERDKVKAQAADAARLVVARLRTLAPRLGPMLASLNDPAECTALIDKEVRELVLEFQDMMAGM